MENIQEKQEIQNKGTIIQTELGPKCAKSYAKGDVLYFHQKFVEDITMSFADLEKQKKSDEQLILSAEKIKRDINSLNEIVEFVSEEAKKGDLRDILFNENLYLAYEKNGLTSTIYHSADVTMGTAFLAYACGMRGDELKAVILASQNHDIGKSESRCLELVGYDGKLSKGEYEEIKQHVKHGVEIAGKSFEQTNIGSLAIRYVQEHHENVDGTGYLKGLEGDQISKGAKIIRIEDCRSSCRNRPDRVNDTKGKILTMDEFRDELVKYRGSWYDPYIVDMLLEGYKPETKEKMSVH